MKRRIVMAVLALGAIGGYAMGFCSLHRHHHDRRAAFERHVASVCVDAARDLKENAAEPNRGAPR